MSIENNNSMDARDGNIDGLEDLDPMHTAESEHPYTEATAESLATDEIIYDGGDAAMMTPEDETTPVDEALHADHDLNYRETIDERLEQEEPDPAAQITFGGDPLRR